MVLEFAILNPTAILPASSTGCVSQCQGEKKPVTFLIKNCLENIHFAALSTEICLPPSLILSTSALVYRLTSFSVRVSLFTA